MNRQPEHSTGGVPWRELQEAIADQARDTIRFIREKDVSGKVPPQYVEAALMVSSHWKNRHDANHPLESVLSEIHADLDGMESDYPGEPLWDRLRAFAAGFLAGRGHLPESVALIANMSHMRYIVETVFELPQFFEGPPDVLRSWVALFTTLINREVQSDLERTIDFKRHVRSYVIINLSQTLDDPEFATLEQEIAELSGESYDPLRDWVELEVSDYAPGASWDEYEQLTRDESLWNGLPMPRRQAALHNMALAETTLLDSAITGMVFEALRQEFNAIEQDNPDARIQQELRRIMALSLFDHGFRARGHTFARTIQDPAVLGETVNGLLRRNNTDDARKLLIDIPDTDVVVAILREGAWPDRRVADQLLGEITTLDQS